MKFSTWAFTYNEALISLILKKDKDPLDSGVFGPINVVMSIVRCFHRLETIISTIYYLSLS